MRRYLLVDGTGAEVPHQVLDGGQLLLLRTNLPVGADGAGR